MKDEICVISDCYVEACSDGGVCLCVRIEGLPGCMRVRPRTPEWDALWALTGVERPSDADMAGDLGAAMQQLKRASIALRPVYRRAAA